MKLFLDSSAIIEFLKGNERARDPLRSAEALYTSVLCSYEVLLGERYNELKNVKSSYTQAGLFFASIETLPITYADSVKSADIGAVLVRRGKKIDDIDIAIAAQAMTKGATVLTRNAKHFEAIKEEYSALSLQRV